MCMHDNLVNVSNVRAEHSYGCLLQGGSVHDNLVNVSNVQAEQSYGWLLQNRIVSQSVSRGQVSF